MITLQDLRFNNMYSYGEDNYINFTGSTIQQLSGENGFGKTSISLIIQELLYSKNIKGIKKDDILNRFSNADYWDGTIRFNSADHAYSVYVHRKGAKAKVVLLEDGIDISEHKIPDTYKKIESIIGHDFTAFTQLTYQSSKDSLDFIKATDTNRKKFLINLFKLEKYLLIGDKVKLVLSASEKTLLGLEGQLVAVTKYLVENPVREPQDLEEEPFVDEDILLQIDRIKEKLSEINQINNKVTKNNTYKKELFSLEFKDLQPVEGLDLLEKRLNDVNSSLFNIESTKNKLIKERKSLDLRDECYVCHQPIDNSQQLNIKNNLDIEINQLEVSYKNINNERETIVHEILQLKKQQDAYIKDQKNKQRITQLQELIDNNLSNTLLDRNTFEKDINLLKTNYDQQVEARNKIRKLNQAKTEFNNRLEGINSQRRKFLAEEILIKTDIDELRQKISRLTILKQAFSPTGIVAFKLENLTKDLEDCINDYLTQLSDGKFFIIFRLVGEKLNIIVNNQGIESVIETFSEGEFSRIQTSVLLAIREILVNIGGGNAINLLFLDEITGVLDQDGKEKLIETLLTRKDLNVILIAHDFENPLVNKIKCSKINNISRIN